MYTSNYRTADLLRLRGSGRQGSTLFENIDFTTPCIVEGVYSWRTGKNAVSDPPVSPRVKQETRDGFGIRTPSQRGSLVERLADRKRYMEEFQRAAFPAETQTGSVSTDRVSKTDSGHLFASMKVLRKPHLGTMHVRQDSTRYYDGDIWAGAYSPGFLNPSSYSFGFTTNTQGLLSVSNAQRQGTANRYFSATAPDRNTGSLMVTLVELLRGDIPSVLKNFQEMMAGMRSIRNLLGSDTLNIMFGWTPIIQEYANIIKVGMALERVVYYESFRRKRQWEGPTASNEVLHTNTISHLGGLWGNAYQFLSPGSVRGPSGGWGVTYDAVTRTVESEDYHLTSRYTGLAKASRRANSFSDQAMDVSKRLGLVDDPQMLWDLTPYSWLVDWFTTMGDSISNANVYSPLRGKYNVDYAYLTSQRVQAVETVLLRKIGTPPAYTFEASLKNTKSFVNTTTRWRDRATPFGFGTQLGSLSASQFAILVALGLAQSR